MPLRKYADEAEARRVRALQTRIWQREARARRLAEDAARRRASTRSRTAVRYVPTFAYCPGAVALGLLYGDPRFR